MSTDPSRSIRSAADDWTVQRVLDWTTRHLKQRGSESPRLDAELLLAYSRGCERIELYTRYDEVLSERERETMRELVKRRAASEPVAYLIGHREFYSLAFHVTSDVLIPRPDTETLVLETLAFAKTFSSPSILDVGTGSGCIAISLAKNHPGATVTAVDISPEALEIARTNAIRHRVENRIRFVQSDLFASLTDSDRFDFIVSNPPYVRDDEWETLPADIRLHEPSSALLAGSDGLDVIRRLISDAPQHLAESGHLLLEIDPGQRVAVGHLLQSGSTFVEVQFLRDLSGADRVAWSHR